MLSPAARDAPRTTPKGRRGGLGSPAIGISRPDDLGRIEARTRRRDPGPGPRDHVADGWPRGPLDELVPQELLRAMRASRSLGPDLVRHAANGNGLLAVEPTRRRGVAGRWTSRASAIGTFAGRCTESGRPRRGTAGDRT